MKVVPIKMDIYDIQLLVTEAEARALMEFVREHAQNTENTNLQQASQSLISAIKDMIEIEG